MIQVEYTVVCDGCGLHGPGSGLTPIDAQLRAQADGWTTGFAETQHWCPPCTRTRQETDRG